MMRITPSFLVVAGLCGLIARAQTAAPSLRNDPARSLALARRQELERAREAQVSVELERQAGALREVERIRDLPIPVARALAQGRIRAEDLVFDADNGIVETPVVSGLLAPAREDRPPRMHGVLRVGGLSLGVMLILLGVFSGRRRRIGEREAAATPGTTRNRVHSLEE